MNDSLELILDHYHNPRNFFVPKKYSKYAKKSNISCGDEIEVYLFVKFGKIIDCGFQGEGCSITIASASLYMEYIKNKRTVHVKKMSFEDFLDIVDITLTPSRQKCALVVFEAVKKALNED